MLFIYNIGVRFYALLVTIVSIFNAKARQWVNGRRVQKVTKTPKRSIWFHFASLGEFEQGRPVLEALRNLYTDAYIIVTFFSPSGYEIRKNTPLADAVYYLPIDTPANARNFIDTIQPNVAVFTKYEYWYHYYNELNERKIPLYLISGIFRPKQVFFKWYGGLHRRMLSFISRLFVQDEVSRNLLQSIGINHVQVSGDTRFDRVWANALQPKSLPLIKNFKADSPVFIGGSTWPPDEELIASLVSRYPNWKFIFAPHEISETKIEQLLSLLPKNETIRFSLIGNATHSLSHYRILVIDNIGMLSALYQYADIAYVGGGFGKGIHNTLEAAAFGLPVIFGPNYTRFREACELIELQSGFKIRDTEDLNQITDRLISNPDKRLTAGAKAKQYVQEHTGATKIITDYIKKAI